MDNLIDELVRERAQAAALQLELEVVPGFWLLPGLGLGLGFQLHSRGVLAAGLLFGLLCRDVPCCLVCAGLQLGEPRCPVILLRFSLRARLRLRLGSGRRVHVRGAL